MNENKKMILGYSVGGLLVIVIVPSVIYALTALLNRVRSFEIIPNSNINSFLIILLLILGLIFAISSLIFQNKVGKGGPVEIGNIEISPKTKHLVVTGPYKYTRNPMLLATFLIYLAFALYINSIYALLLVCLIFVFMLTVVVKMEEKRLLKDFGNEYENYRKRVSKFIPWFRRKKIE